MSVFSIDVCPARKRGQAQNSQSLCVVEFELQSADGKNPPGGRRGEAIQLRKFGDISMPPGGDTTGSLGKTCPWASLPSWVNAEHIYQHTHRECIASPNSLLVLQSV